jgi:hypothetical protein
MSLFASAAFAQDSGDSVVRWKGIVGVTTAVNADNPVGNIHSGTFAWSARSGRAAVNLTSGYVYFDVDGLVINGTAFSGTAGPVTDVVGTLVCSAGSRQQAVRDTKAVHISKAGAAHFAGAVGGIPANCANPIFLIRIAVPTGAAGRWIATGAERFDGP